MKKSFLMLGAALLVLAVPAFASLTDSISWVDTIPGMRVIKFEERYNKIEKEYTLDNPVKCYNSVVAGLRKNGWKVTYGESCEVVDGTDIREIDALKDNQKMEIDVDLESRFGKEVYVMELEVKSHR